MDSITNMMIWYDEREEEVKEKAKEVEEERKDKSPPPHLCSVSGSALAFKLFFFGMIVGQKIGIEGFHILRHALCFWTTEEP